MSRLQNDVILEDLHELDIEKGIYKIYDIPKGVIVYTPADDGSKYIRFKFHDGKFGYFTTYNGNIAYLPIDTKLERHRNGYILKGKLKINVPPMKISISDTSWQGEEEVRESIQKMIRESTYAEICRQAETYLDMVCAQLDESHMQYLDTLIELVREQVLRERIILGRTAPDVLRK